MTRRHQDYRTRRLSHLDVQVADDLQSVVRETRNQRRGRAARRGSDNFSAAFPEICRFTNFHGALITMPHKVSVIGLIDAVSTAVKVAGSCNAVRRGGDGRLVGDMFDGEGFVRGVARHGHSLAGKKVLVVGAGGVGSAIAASTAAAGAAEIALFDVALPRCRLWRSGSGKTIRILRSRSARTTRAGSTWS